MKIPSTWQIFCPDSEPENMWIAEKRNRAGKVFNISRNFWAYLSDRYSSNLENPGIYVLVGGNDERTIYIGQSENLFKRIGEHLQDAGKSFFNRAIFVTESNLNNAHFRWMEAHLIQQGRDTKRYHIINGSTPNKPRLSESDASAAQEFLDELKQLFSIIGIDAFITPKTISLTEQSQTETRERTRLDTELLEYILAFVHRFQSGTGFAELTIGEMIATAYDGLPTNELSRALPRWGVKIRRPKAGGALVCFSLSGQGINQALRGTRWQDGWKVTLARMPGAVKSTTPMSFDGKSARFVSLPIAAVLPDCHEIPEPQVSVSRRKSTAANGH